MRGGLTRTGGSSHLCGWARTDGQKLTKSWHLLSHSCSGYCVFGTQTPLANDFIFPVGLTIAQLRILLIGIEVRQSHSLPYPHISRVPENFQQRAQDISSFSRDNSEQLLRTAAFPLVFMITSLHLLSNN